DTEVVNGLKQLNVLRSEQTLVLLLAAHQRYYSGESPDNKAFKKLVTLLVNFTFRYITIMGMNPNVLERDYSELAIKLRKGEGTSESIRTKLLELYPSDTVFVASFSNKELKNNALAKHILTKINRLQLVTNEQRECK